MKNLYWRPLLVLFSWICHPASTLAQSQVKDEPSPSGVSRLGVAAEEGTESLWRTLLEVWDFQIFAVGDKVIRTSNLVIAALIFVVGVLLSKLLSRQLKRVLLRRAKLHEGAAAALQKLTFYFLTLGVLFFALNLANIPLTIFTVLGGALAIGIGFGSQNIMNNFISGLIILIERPVRVGDIIDVDETRGKVRSIGARSTCITTFDNIDIIVPNSTFLERNVINWTLGDDTLRRHIAVGVVYGSPVDKATELLLKAAREHAEVLKKPEPFVWFVNFGDNSLDFELYFWVRLKTTRSIFATESDLRYRIDALFREAGIVIAFPQRDVHLFPVRPLEVRMVEKGPEKTA